LLRRHAYDFAMRYEAFCYAACCEAAMPLTAAAMTRAVDVAVDMSLSAFTPFMMRAT